MAFASRMQQRCAPKLIHLIHVSALCKECRHSGGASVVGSSYERRPAIPDITGCAALGVSIMRRRGRRRPRTL